MQYRPGRFAVVFQRFAALLVVFATIAAITVLSRPPIAAAVELPPTTNNDLFIQTSGPNAPITIGDYYTSPTGAGGAGQDHLIDIVIPVDWPGLAVTIALYDPRA